MRLGAPPAHGGLFLKGQNVAQVADKIDRVDLTEIDRHFADLIKSLDPDRDGALWLAAALASNATQKGNVCLDLRAVAGKALTLGEPPDAAPIQCPEVSSWRGTLASARTVGAPGEFKPLILDRQERLYLYRYWSYEQSLAIFMLSRASRILDVPDPALQSDALERLFPPTQGNDPDFQRIAALLASCRMLCIITGGPGTGKTSTVVRILALLLENSGSRKLRISLAAPTGKAAARLRESVKRTKNSLICDASIKDQIPEEASTLHRLLGFTGSATRFRFDSENPLPRDVVVVDEASMIDMPLMAKLVQALPNSCRLILLGDRDQLASVQPGAVFGDICDTGRRHPYSAQLLGAIGRRSGADLQPDTPAAQPGLQDSIVTLQKSFRFDEQSGIGSISRLVNQGLGPAALAAAESGHYKDILWRDIPSPRRLEEALEELIVEAYGPYLKAASPEEIFDAFGRFRILCPVRQGPYGVETVNRIATNILARANLIRPSEQWYRGLPVLITKNDYQLRLFNGDIGIILADPDDQGGTAPVKRAYFPTETGEFRKIFPMRLPENEPVYAMTVHKSQGSEFERILLLLPPVWTEVLTRELLYTGMTRAMKRVEIWGNREVFLQAVSHRIERASGLRDALWGTRVKLSPLFVTPRRGTGEPGVPGGNGV